MVKQKKIAVAAVIAFVLISAAVLAATLYPYAVVSFSGVKMVTNASTTQGFVDITLKNVNTTGISFCLSYDKSIIQLSDVSDNTPVQNSATTDVSGNSFDIAHKYFEQNTEAFPNGSFRDVQIPGLVGVNTPIIGIADPNTGHLIMNFLPTEEAALTSSYIDNVVVDKNVKPCIMANTSDGVSLGRLSFKILDPASFSKLTSAELENIIKIVPFAEMITVDDPDISSDDGIHISYIDENDDIKWYSRSDKNIDYEFNIEAELSKVEPQISEMTVSAYEIYKQGTDQDLIDFINEKMSVLTLFYADGSQVPALFEWKRDDSNLDSISYDPKTGDYTVTQPYNADYTVTVTIHVTPVKLTAFNVDKEDITYLYGAEGYPTLFEQLELPKTAKPVFDTYLPNGGIDGVPISWYQLEGTSSGVDETALMAEFALGVPKTFGFIGHLGSEATTILDNCLWLTQDYPLPEIRMTRSIVDNADDMPKQLELISAETDTSGILNIAVRNADLTAIPDGTVFRIKMPGGEVIDTDSLGSRYTVTIESDGTAKITIQPDKSVSGEEKLAQVVNLGGRAGSFAIASQEPSKTMGSDLMFEPVPRRNLYTGPDYEFDYSSQYAAMFPVKAGTTLPLTVTLPVASDRIVTSYNGYDGTEPGQLSTFTVDSWTVTGDTSTAGSVITATGRLADTAYTNYGAVANDDNVNITIKYLVVENEGADSIDTIADFVYNTQQVGYGYDKLQTQSFTVRNNGITDIYGLTAVISLSDVNGKEAFIQTKDLPLILGKGQSTQFDITTKIGLPADTYVSTVSLMSNNKVLQTFKITFTVSSEPVYNIKITIDEAQKDFGTAKTQSETYTAMENEVITVIAEAETDCAFTGWEVVSGDVTFADSTQAMTTFDMPAGDVEIKATFKELVGAKLRATELQVKDKSDVSQTLYDETWKTVMFDPVKREYYVAVSNDSDTAKLWFKLRTEAENAALSLTHEHDGTTDTLSVPVKDTADEFYKSDDIQLTESPVDNIVTLKMKYDDPSDDPDEGLVEREYKIHIYRKLKNSDLMVFNYGNSPYGLIMRDGTIADKDAAKQAFRDNNYTFMAGFTPAGQTEGLTYSGKAWGGVNYDLDDSALFVINSSPFTDPGYSSVQNSIGGSVTAVTKKITVKLLAETNTALKNGSSDDFVYINSSTISLPDTGQITNLMSERIRPDSYSLTYSFTDFDGSTATVTRPLILLSPLGDINIDDTADASDVSRVLNRFSTDIADNINVNDYNIGGLLYRYRVCDANKDGNINAIDANFIRANELTPFYTNLLEGGGG